MCAFILVYFSRSHYKAAAAPKPPVSSICVIMANYNTMTQHLLILEDGRVLVTKKLATHFDGMLYIDDSCTKIYEETSYRKDHYCHSALHFKEYGVTHWNNIFQAQLQVKMNAMWAKYKDGTHGEPHVISVEERNNTLIVTREIFTLPFEVEPNYFNLVDGEEESMCVDVLPSGYWAVFVLRKTKEFISPQRTRGIHIRGQLAIGTAKAGLKRSPADINTGFGGSGVASGARPNPIFGPTPTLQSMTNTTTMNIDTTTMNIDHFHSPANDNDDLTV